MNTIEVIADLMYNKDNKLQYFLIVGAYRDNEVSSTHPLMLALNAAHRKGVEISDLELLPLSQADVVQLVRDTFYEQGMRPIVINAHACVYSPPPLSIFFTSVCL